MLVTEWKCGHKKCSYWLKLPPRSHMLLILSFVHALSSYRTYLSRTVPGVSDLFQPLEMPSTKLISSLTECPPCSKLTRDLLVLPVRLGGLGLVNPMETSNKLQVYKKLTAPPLSHMIKPVKLILMISSSWRIRTVRIKLIASRRTRLLLTQGWV